MPVPWLLKFWHGAGRSCIDKYIAACLPCGIYHWFCPRCPGWFDHCHNSGCGRCGWFFERAICRNDFRIVYWLCPNFLFLGSLNFCPFAVDHYCAAVLQKTEKTCCNNNRLFLVLGTAVQNQQNLRSHVWLHCLVVVLRLNAYFQLRYFIFCTTKITVLSFIFMACRSKLSSLRKPIFALLNYDSWAMLNSAKLIPNASCASLDFCIR